MKKYVSSYADVYLLNKIKSKFNEIIMKISTPVFSTSFLPTSHWMKVALMKSNIVLLFWSIGGPEIEFKSQLSML